MFRYILPWSHSKVNGSNFEFFGKVSDITEKGGGDEFQIKFSQQLFG